VKAMMGMQKLDIAALERAAEMSGVIPTVGGAGAGVGIDGFTRPVKC
jgi:hypothetical protein